MENLQNEENKKFSENNNVDYENNNIYDFSFESNKIDKPRPKKKEKKDKQSLNLISKFVFMCAVVSTIQIGVYIPIFNDIFNTPSVAEITESPPTVSFEEVSTLHNRVDFTITIENADLSQEDYYLYLTKQEDATDEFIESVPDSIKEAEGKKITSNIFFGNFERYLTSTGGQTLMQSTNYALILVKDNKIIKKEIATTKDRVYITGLTIREEPGSDANHKFFKFQVTIDDGFTKFTYLFFKLTRLSTNEDVEGYGVLEKASVGLDINIASAGIDVNTEESSVFILRIYCETDNPELYAGMPLKNMDETRKGYLIYTHISTI